MSVITSLLQVNPVDGNESYTTAGSIFVDVNLIPPGVAIVLSLPPFAIVLSPSEALELAAVLTSLAELVP